MKTSDRYSHKRSSIVLTVIVLLGVGLVALLFSGLISTARAANLAPAPAAPAARSVVTIPLPNQSGLEPYSMAYNDFNGYVYVSNNNSSDVSVIDGTAIIARVTVGGGPKGLTYNPGNHLIYVANENADTVSAINGATKVADIPVGNRPVNLAYNPVNGYIYVADTVSDTVSVIDGLAVIPGGTIPVGNHPSVVIVNTKPDSPNYGDVYVTNLLGNSVSILSAAALPTVVATLPTDLRPTDISINDFTGYVYVANADSNSVTVIDSATRTVARTILVNTNPTAVTTDDGNDKAYVLNTGGDSLNVLRNRSKALPQSYFKLDNFPRRARVDPVTHYLYVSNALSDTVSVLDGSQYTVTALATLVVGDGPQPILVHPTNGNIYVGNRGGNSISVLNSLANIATIQPQYYPGQILINPANGYAYIPMRGGNVVRVYNGVTLVAEIPVEHNPRDLALNTTTGNLYVPNADSDTVSVINGTSTVATVKVQAGPLFAVADSANDRIYVTNWFSDSVSVLSGSTLLGNVAVGKNPRRAAIDPNTGNAYVVNAFGNTVSVLNGITLVNTLAAGQEPRFVLYNPVTHYMYVSNKTDGTVSVFDGMLKLGDVTVGSQPEDMAVDADGKVYVSNFASNNISVIDGATPGLPSVVATIPVGNGPEGITAANGQVFVTNTSSNSVSVIHGNKVVNTYTVGASPRSVGYAPSTDLVYVSNYEGASLSLLQAEVPQVDFSGTPRTGSAPLDVQFTSQITGVITSYLWEFGDGITSTLVNPGHTYNGAGVYGVTLHASGPGGDAATTKVSYITVNPAAGAPTASFSADLLSGNAPLDVNFTAVTTGTVTTWSWNFGDGGSASSGPIVQHTYTTPGVYDVILTVGNAQGDYVVSKPHYIRVTVLDTTVRVYLPLIVR